MMTKRKRAVIVLLTSVVTIAIMVTVFVVLEGVWFKLAVLILFLLAALLQNFAFADTQK